MLRLGLLTVLFCSCAAASERPNVLIVMTDDQGKGDFSIHGNPALKTPHLDRLATESIRFTDFHVAPMCTPTRGQLMSGLDAVRNGATSVTGGRSFMRTVSPLSRNCYAMPVTVQVSLANGISVIIILIAYGSRFRSSGLAPWLGFYVGPRICQYAFDGRYLEQDQLRSFKGHCTDFWFDRAIEWMQQCKRDQQPFFCYLPLNAPHAPHVVADSYAAPYRSQGPAPFFGMIAQIDENMESWKLS